MRRSQTLWGYVYILYTTCFMSSVPGGHAIDQAFIQRLPLYLFAMLAKLLHSLHYMHNVIETYRNSSLKDQEHIFQNLKSDHVPFTFRPLLGETPGLNLRNHGRV